MSERRAANARARAYRFERHLVLQIIIVLESRFFVSGRVRELDGCVGVCGCVWVCGWAQCTMAGAGVGTRDGRSAAGGSEKAPS